MVCTVNRDGSKGGHGGKDLASSAAFTGFFCRALLRIWLAAVSETLPAVYVPDSDCEVLTEAPDVGAVVPTIDLTC